MAGLMVIIAYRIYVGSKELNDLLTITIIIITRRLFESDGLNSSSGRV